MIISFAQNLLLDYPLWTALSMLEISPLGPWESEVKRILQPLRKGSGSSLYDVTGNAVVFAVMVL